MLIEYAQSLLHQLVVIWDLTRRGTQVVDSRFFSEANPNFRD